MTTTTPLFANTRKYKDKTALVVEDQENMRNATVRMLSDIGFKQVYQAKNGHEALVFLKDRSVDLILSDWMMPKMNGLELLIQVRANEKHKDVPFLMSTVVVDQAQVLQAIHAGVSEYLAKPFSYAMLRDRLEKAFTKPLNKRIAPKQTEVEIDVKATSIPEELEARAQKQILVVDDIPDNIQVIAEIVKPLAKVRAATSGKAALKICRSANKPDLILLDIMMPEMDGYDVIRELKADENTRDIPVIFLTAKTEVEDITKGFELEAVDYVTKPVQPAVLVARVNNQLRILDYQNSMKSQVDTMMQNIRLREDIDRIVRHDINNPLTAILGAAEQITFKSATPKSIAQSSEIIMQSAMVIHQMVGNLSTLSKMEQDGIQIERKPLAISEVVSHVVESFPQDIKSKSLQVEVDVSESLYVLGERTLLYSLFANLTKNAIDASPRGTRLDIVAVDSGENIQISVTNFGAVPEEIRENFFEKYVTKGKANGTGLGTYSAKLISEAHGGSIALDAKEASTTLTVTLPKTEER